MNSFMHGFSRFVYKFRMPILAVTALITVFLGYELATKIRINTDIISYLPDTDRAVALSNEIGDSFGSNELALIVVEADDIFNPEVIKHVDLITKTLKGMEGISSVTSLTDVMDIKEGADGSIEVGKLIDMDSNPDISRESTAKLREYTLAKKIYRGKVISPDGRSTLIAAFLAQEARKDTTAKNIKAAVKALGLKEKIYFGGTPFMMQSLTELMINDLIRLVPIVTILIVITLFLSFGTIRGVLVPLVSVLISNVWVLGFMAMCGVPMTVISTVIPVLLIAIGTAPSIHILSKFDEDPQKRYGSTGEESVNAFSEVGLRVILTSLTVIFGFTSFIFGSYLTMIREFGIFMSIGVFFALIISVMVIPAVLSYVKVGEKKISIRKGPTFAERILEKLGKFVISYRVPVLVISFIFAVVGLAGTPFIKRGFDMVDFFKADHEVKATNAAVQKNFGGTKPIQIVFRGDVQNPALLRQMRKTDKYLETVEGMANPQSVSMMIAEMDDIMEGGRRIPDSREKVVNLWFMLEGQDMVNRLVSPDLNSGLIQAVYGDGFNDAVMLSDLAAYCAGMDKEFYQYSRTNTTPAAVTDYLVAEAASTARFDLLKRDRKAAVSDADVITVLNRHMKGGKLDVKKAAVDIEAMLPAEKHDSFLVSDITDDLLFVNDTELYLPARVYKTLPDAVEDAEPVRFEVEHTGLPLIYQHLNESLLKSQVESFIYALIFIYVLFVIQLRSFKFGFIGLVPIVLTVFMMFGIMGFFGIQLDVATVLCGSIALGIGIDYAIHFSVRFKSYSVAGLPVKEAVLETLRTTGKAITINVTAVTMGFFTMLFAGLVPLQHFAILVATAMIVSGTGTLTTLPAMLLKSNPKFLGKSDRKKGEIK
ncbi:MAG: MMPL family transporter [Spirochaetia bacterium]|nr:MMPL family transporter [Spirochaetia bacterium]